jgi:Tfp pilus assembly protein PilV
MVEKEKHISSNNIRGFAMVEVIISIFILAAMLVIYGRANDTIAMNQGVKYQEIALRIAHSQIETLRSLPYDSLPSSGPFADTELASLPQGTGSVSVTAFNSSTKNVTVTVSWVEARNAQARSVALGTLITQGGL